MVTMYYASPLRGGQSGVLPWFLGVIIAYLGLGFAMPLLFTAETDEAQHTQTCQAIVSSVTDMVGSRLVGQNLAMGVGYAKETLDWLTGAGWSNADIEADLEGTYAGAP